MLWIHDITLLYTETRLWPFYETTAHAKVNAFARFVIYYGLLLSILKKNANHLIVTIGVMLVATIFWNYTQADVSPLDMSPSDVSPLDVSPLDVSPLDVSQDVSSACPEVSVHNSMGNPVIGVHNNTVNNQCTVNPEQAKNMFIHNMPMDHWDIYGKNNSQRQFYTVPVNDQSAFAKWLYDPDIVMRCDKTQKAC